MECEICLYLFGRADDWRNLETNTEKDTHTHTHTHTARERERERERSSSTKSSVTTTGTTWRERGERERIAAIFVLQCFCIVASSCTNSRDPRNDTWKLQAPLAAAAAAATTRKEGRSDETGRADGLTDWLTEWMNEWSVLERKGGSFQGGFAERRRNSWNKNKKPKPNRGKFKSTIFKLWSTHQILGAGDTIAEDQRIQCFFLLVSAIACLNAS